MTLKSRKTASVRLTEAQYEEMEHLGIETESAYVRYKMEQAQEQIALLKTPLNQSIVKTLPATKAVAAKQTAMEDQLTIQRLAMENSQLKTKLEAIDQNNREALNGVNQRVHSLLQDELFKRDFEILKKEHAQREEKIKELDVLLNTAKKESESKQEEIEALVKKLGLVELGKTLLPSAISGLAKHYPNQMKGIAGTLGQLGLEQNSNSQEIDDQTHRLQIIDYLLEAFTEVQFEHALQLMIVLSDQIKGDPQIIKKIHYYLNQLKQNKAQEQPVESNT